MKRRVSELLGRIKCRVGLHIGHIEAHGDHLYFKCTRCERLVSPKRVERDWLDDED